MNFLGTKYGGWFLPKNTILNENSIIYSVGVGEDISFDIVLSEKYNPNIFLIDPTPRAIKHYNEMKDKFINQKNLSISITNDYANIIKNTKPNFNKFNYIDKALWNTQTELKFYSQHNQNYVSHSLLDTMFQDKNYFIVQTDTLKNIMLTNQHDKIDLLKIDIEGAEIVVIENMIDNNIFPTDRKSVV